MSDYKIKIIDQMIKAEEAPNGGFGAHLSMNWANLKSIQLDADALKALRRHYKLRNTIQKRLKEKEEKAE